MRNTFNIMAAVMFRTEIVEQKEDSFHPLCFFANESEWTDSI
jgi:hypothetical protein